MASAGWSTFGRGARRAIVSTSHRNKADGDSEREDADPFVHAQPSDGVREIYTHPFDEEPTEGIAAYVDGEKAARAQPTLAFDEQTRPMTARFQTDS